LQDDFDYTSADNQKLLYDYHKAFLKIDSIIKKEDGSLPNFWLQEFRWWLLGTTHVVISYLLLQRQNQLYTRPPALPS